MRLSEILNEVETVQVIGNAEEREIENIATDSRAAGKNDIFVAITGFNVDAHKFVPDVVNKGVAAVVIEKNIFPEEIFTHSGVVKILVKDSRKALAQISNVFYGKPSEKLTLTGITGTKGKTTTTFYLKGIYDAAGVKSGLVGTIKNIVGAREEKAKLTTPESYTLNRFFSEMLAEGVTHCVMEVSSHSLSLKRVYGLDFDFAGFTNLQSDHLDFYQTRLKYFLAKKVLFDGLKKEAVAAVNIDDEHGRKIIADTQAKVVTYGTSDEADFVIKNVKSNLQGTSFDLSCKGETVRIRTKLVGEFNAYNAALAFAIAAENGFDFETIVKGIERTPHVPGRFEVIEINGKTAIVDYAHNAGSLEKVLISLRKIIGDAKKIFTVFGAGGDRDRSKRSEMGAVAENNSDKIFVTSDNPRSEKPEKIIDDILKGVKGENVYVNPDREETIAEAIREADENTVVLIAGKGHEDYQEVNGERTHFSDRETAEKYLSE
jgi:UDP-N-acetylmuramoyl-L-alanyl-D-glutamate--2,6-diaminopimelate ligase